MARIRWALAALLALMVLTQSAAAADGAALLTITGDIENTNRGPFDAFKDGYLNARGMTFEKAFEFDEASLLSLPQRQVTVAAESWSASLAMSGPLLADVLQAAGATGKPITVFALDGFGKPMTPEQVSAGDWVLATHANGVALGIGGRGPLWLVHDTGAAEATAQEERNWVWSVFHIAVGK